MPTYQYRCTECGRELEAVQRFSDPSLTECPECSGALRKIYNAVGVVFKGSGFYRTDSRAKTGGDGATADKSTKDAPATAEAATPATNGSTKKSATPTPAASGASTGSKAASD